MKYILHIVRGLPGSGKSTFARSLGCLHLEADMYWMRDGKYQFDPLKVPENHIWCQSMCESAMKQGSPEIVVSNTFVRKWEIAHYLDLAKEYDYQIKIYEMKEYFGNVHNVPQDTLDRMKSQWEVL